VLYTHPYQSVFFGECCMSSEYCSTCKTDWVSTTFSKCDSITFSGAQFFCGKCLGAVRLSNLYAALFYSRFSSETSMLRNPSELTCCDRSVRKINSIWPASWSVASSIATLIEASVLPVTQYSCIMMHDLPKNHLYCVGWGVQLYSLSRTEHLRVYIFLFCLFL